MQGGLRIDHPVGSQQTVTIPEDHNSLVVRARDHTVVSVWTGTHPLVHTESLDPAIAFTLPPGTYTVRTDGSLETVTTERFRQHPPLFEGLRQGTPALLSLTSDAPDRHVVDDIGEVAADGTSYCTISVQKTGLNGAPMTALEDQDELFLRTTGGVIMDDKGAQRLRSVKLRSGRAAFRLVSEPSPKVVTVSVFSRDPLLSPAEIRVEFI